MKPVGLTGGPLYTSKALVVVVVVVVDVVVVVVVDVVGGAEGSKMVVALRG